MNTQKESITIRSVVPADIENLAVFFIKAYGENTIFQNRVFLNYFFDNNRNQRPTFKYSLIAINDSGAIVSHYGGLAYKVNIKGHTHSLVWGVNAFTLPEYREMGINSQILAFITTNYDINGVIGFTESTSNFYQKLGYHIFNFEKFNRHILVLDKPKTIEVCNYINQDSARIPEAPSYLATAIHEPLSNNIIEITKENIDKYPLNLHTPSDQITTTQRSLEFLKWRFLDHPFINYAIYGCVQDGEIIAYIAYREEKLHPLSYKVTRIIDMFGRPKSLSFLLQYTIQDAVFKKHLYIDFSNFGTIYDPVLQGAHFLKLKDNECCILPQVTFPIQDRPNGEFLGLLSTKSSGLINNLTLDNVYFTRMDSDRDRLSSITQIENNNDEY